MPWYRNGCLPVWWNDNSRSLYYAECFISKQQSQRCASKIFLPARALFCVRRSVSIESLRRSCSAVLPTCFLSKPGRPVIPDCTTIYKYVCIGCDQRKVWPRWYNLSMTVICFQKPVSRVFASRGGVHYLVHLASMEIAQPITNKSLLQSSDHCCLCPQLPGHVLQGGGTHSRAMHTCADLTSALGLLICFGGQAAWPVLP